MLFGRSAGGKGNGSPRAGNGQEFRNKNIDSERRQEEMGALGGFDAASPQMGKGALDVWYGEKGVEVKRVHAGAPPTPGAKRIMVAPGGKLFGNSRVPAGYVGVAVYRGGDIYPQPLGPGAHIIPLAKETKLLSVHQQPASMAGQMVSADGVQVDVAVTIFFRMLPEFGTLMHLAFPNGYKGAVETLLGDVAKSVIEQNGAEGIYREQQRVRDEVREGVKQAMEAAGFRVDEVLVKKIGLPANFEESIRKRSEIAPLTEQNRALTDFEITNIRLQQAIGMAQLTINQEIGVQQADLEIMILRLEKAKEILIAQADRAIAIEKAGGEADVRRQQWIVEAEVQSEQMELQARHLSLSGKAEAEVTQEKGEAEMEVRRVKGDVEAETIGKKIGAVVDGVFRLGRKG